MNKSQITMTITLALFTGSVGWAQTDQTQPTAPPPAPAFGEENPVPPVSENPPISAVDQPGLEPHAAPESFLLPGLHFSQSLDSNVGNELGGSSLGSITRGLGSLTLQRLWKNYDVAMDYIGGAAFYSSGIGLEQLQQLDIDNRINWKRGQLSIRDSFSYLPEGVFGFGAYGGGSAYDAGFGGMGAGLLGAGGFGGQSDAFAGGSGVSLGHGPRLTNLGLADVVENLTPKSAITMAVGYGLVHFYSGDYESAAQPTIPFVGSRKLTAQVAYDRILGPKDQFAISYGYQAFDFSISQSAFHTSVVQLLYGHRISGRMDLKLSAGPQFTHLDENPQVCFILGYPSNVPPSQCTTGPIPGTVMVVPQASNHLGVAGRVSLRYRFPRTSVSLSFQRYNTEGAGVFAGSLSNIARLDIQRPLTRVWSAFSDFGFAKNSRLQIVGSSGPATSLTYGFAGVGLHRQFSRSLRGFVSYQFNDLSFDNGCAGTTTSCSSMARRQVGSIGLDWTPRPIRLD